MKHERDDGSGARSLREPTRVDFSNNSPEAHSWQSRRRLRRPQGWHELEGRAERESGEADCDEGTPASWCQTVGRAEDGLTNGKQMFLMAVDSGWHSRTIVSHSKKRGSGGVSGHPET